MSAQPVQQEANVRRVAGALTVIAMVMAAQGPAQADDAITAPFRFATTFSTCHPGTPAVDCVHALTSAREGYVQQVTWVTSSGAPASGDGVGYGLLHHVWTLAEPASHLEFRFHVRIHEASAEVDGGPLPIPHGEAAVATHAFADSFACQDCTETFVSGHPIVSSVGPKVSVEDVNLVLTASIDGEIPPGPIDLNFGFTTSGRVGFRQSLETAPPAHVSGSVGAPAPATTESWLLASVSRIDVVVTAA